ncbi:hypothetical protein RHGRI_022912 [Rhododendron griersonianum]|uniref:Uncharacterized protein n=1 Tax=Rhododendron griersonianum TaxID=479676 RepID=A0AAV6J3Y9_9ERIC|nr:hypothetical protein RHGRI_022912 [Rhododendron griersonianum]
MAASPCSSKPHMVLFPFMSKGHTIPLLHLARLLHRRNISVTFFTTAANRLFISDSLSDTDASIVELPFPQDIEGLPAGVENTEKLPSMSLFVPFANARKLMQPNFEEALETLPQITSIISDGFLWWTQQSATKFGIPRLVSYGFSNYSKAVRSDVMTNGLLSGPELDDDEPFPLTNFPWIKLTRNDFDEPLHSREPKGPYMDFITEVVIATSKSYGIVSNSFYELEALYVEYCNRESGPKSWCIGPLCWAVVPKTEPRSLRKPTWLQWLDQKLAEGSTVLYVAFGSQAQISSQQLCEIAGGFQHKEYQPPCSLGARFESPCAIVHCPC